jgi:hypothetical protein
MATRTWLRLFVVPALLSLGCSGNSNTPATPSPTPTSPTPTPTPIPTPTPQIAYFVGAGDIADCGATGDAGVHAEATAALIDVMPEAFVFTTGDNAYFDGSAADYNNCYKPRWGRHLFKTYPAPGNHDGYDSGLGGNPYFDYFGGAKQSGDRGAGYYSFSLGNWHIISLNSNAPVGAGSVQYAWLNNDLRANPAKCTLAFWHHPLFTSGPSAGSNGLMRDVWTLLYGANVDVIVNGHDHFYERYFPQDANGVRGQAGGITEYIVGTGGTQLYDFGAILPNSAARFRNFGVLYFTLRDTGWDSVFVEAVTGNRLDFSTGICH